MFANMFHFKNNSQKPEKDFSVCASMLERYYSNRPDCGFTSLCVSPYEIFFVILSEERETYKNVVSKIENFVSCMTKNPDWHLIALDSPKF